MLGAVILLILLYFVSQPILGAFKKQFTFLKMTLMNKLYWYHALFAIIYYLYSVFNSSDSRQYYARAADDTRYTSWLDIYQTGTKFIDFISFPFINTLGFSYEMAMVLFSWFGFLGFIYFYVFFKENISTTLKFKGFDLVMLLLFLPNMHFWTASLGKGSFVFLGIAMFAFALREPQKRFLTLLIGSFIVYGVRPHMMMFLAIGAMVGYITGQEKVPAYQKWVVYGACIAGMFLMYDQVLAMANISEENVLDSFQDFSQLQANRLQGAGSGVDITSYPLPIKLFTFWFRPLFFDAPGALGLYISVENLFYLMLTWKLVDKDFIPFLKKSSSSVKMSLITFIASSIALSFVMSNLGIVIRQKSMVMYFLFFVIMAFMEHKRQKQLITPKSENTLTSAAPHQRLRVI